MCSRLKDQNKAHVVAQEGCRNGHRQVGGDSDRISSVRLDVGLYLVLTVESAAGY